MTLLLIPPLLRSLCFKFPSPYPKLVDGDKVQQITAFRCLNLPRRSLSKLATKSSRSSALPATIGLLAPYFQTSIPLEQLCLALEVLIELIINTAEVKTVESKFLDLVNVLSESVLEDNLLDDVVITKSSADDRESAAPERVTANQVPAAILRWATLVKQQNPLTSARFDMLEEKNLHLKDVKGDENCLFRSIVLSLFKICAYAYIFLASCL